MDRVDFVQVKSAAEYSSWQVDTTLILQISTTCCWIFFPQGTWPVLRHFKGTLTFVGIAAGPQNEILAKNLWLNPQQLVQISPCRFYSGYPRRVNVHGIWSTSIFVGGLVQNWTLISILVSSNVIMCWHITNHEPVLCFFFSFVLICLVVFFCRFLLESYVTFANYRTYRTVWRIMGAQSTSI